MDKEKYLSIVIPMYNEEKNVMPLYEELKSELDKLKLRYEIVIVDDGSKDNTPKILEEIAKKDENLKFIPLMRNFGQTSAFSAGFDNAKGNIIITMDGDMQNDPRDISKLLDKMDEGYDVVSGWRYKRKDNTAKKIPSLFSNWLVRTLTKVNIHDSGCSLKAYRKEALESLNLYGEMHRFIPSLCHFKGFKVGEIKVNHRSRKMGKTKYGMKRLINGFLDLTYVTFWGSYSTKPLHFLGRMGAIQYFLAFLIFIEQFIKAILIKKLLLGPLLLLGVLLVITGTLFIIFGFILEILIRTYYMKSGEKPYLIKK